MPIFSIDYRLAPDNPFPAALNDVYQVFAWLMKNLESQLRIKAHKIFISGDSAGGNLTFALTNLIIQNGL